MNSSRLGSNDYHYERNIEGNNYTYHDTYFGGTRFMGEEVVYCNSNKPIWGMNYYGVTLDKTLGEEAMDNVLRPALIKAGEGHQFITKIEFGNEDEVEGKFIFEDYEAENNIISLGILPDKENVRADVYADILNIEDIEIK